MCYNIQICFYLAATPFNAAQSPYFSKMIEIIGKYGGEGLRIPSVRNELQPCRPIFKEKDWNHFGLLERVQSLIEDIRLHHYARWMERLKEQNTH